MENQHRLIEGYRELSQDDINGINNLKSLEKEFLETIKYNQEKLDADGRWTAIAKTAIEKATMFAVRALAKPNAPEEHTDYSQA